ncbi:putative voltage-gated potassium channel subunit beta [Capsicum baccatum]|uniref:Voltage-gated potassium channel subunit beta n=1 Tax=Capsicum baccatum TaxID=33114 RepID=A0A2G2WK09_CAPBA|nr:putative voltage-gated potassium channel subunit beta [Capsicum baccatum]
MLGVGSKRAGLANGKKKGVKLQKLTIERQTVQLAPIIPSGSLQSHTGSPYVNNSFSRFDPHKVVIDGIANCIQSKFELARPSWKNFPESTREVWFEQFKKEAAGKDPSISEFYIRTHCKKSDKSWVNEKAEATYVDLIYCHRPDTSTPILETVRAMNYVIDKWWAFYWGTSEWSAQQITEAWGVAQRLDLVGPIVVQPEYNLLSRHKKQEILATQCASIVDGETNLASQHAQLSEMNIWVQSVGGKKKGKVKGLGSLGRSVKATSNSTLTLPKEIDEMINSHVGDSNVDLYAQLLNERNKNKRMRKELDLLMKHVYKKSSSNDERQSQEDN